MRVISEMREITADELSKILKEHEKWILTDKKEGKCANLRGTDLSEVLGLSIERLSTVKTLYKAKLGPELIEQVKDEYPHLLEEPKLEE